MTLMKFASELKNSMTEHRKKSLPQKIADGQTKGSYQAVLEDLFENMYSQRFKIYKMNFIRGVMFSAGTVVGGVLVVIFLLWFLSLFDHLPIIGHFVQTVHHSLEKSQVK